MGGAGDTAGAETEAEEAAGGRPRLGSAARRGGLALGLVLAVLAPVALRVVLDGGAELRAADEAADAGDLDAELRHLGRAARWRMPLSTHDEQARARLGQLARAAEEREDHGAALLAWRELRSALLATRGIGVVDEEALAEANAAIVELMAIEAARDRRPVERDRWAAELAAVPGHPRGRSLVAAAAFVGWLAAAMGFFVAGIDGKGRLRPRPALRWGGACLVLLVVWILTM